MYLSGIIIYYSISTHIYMIIYDYAVIFLLCPPLWLQLHLDRRPATTRQFGQTLRPLPLQRSSTSQSQSLRQNVNTEQISDCSIPQVWDPFPSWAPLQTVGPMEPAGQKGQHVLHTNPRKTGGHTLEWQKQIRGHKHRHRLLQFQRL